MIMNSTVELQRLSVGTHHEISEDFTLPDYLPEIRRIVSCTGTVLPESRYMDRGEIVLSGLAVGSVCYVGDDGKLCAFPVNSEYSARLSVASHNTAELSADAMTVRTCLDSISCRATGPRQLVLGFKMRSSVFASHNDALPFDISFSDGTECSVANGMTLEKHVEAFEYTSISNVTSAGSLAGAISEREGTRILSCEGAAVVNSASADSSEVTLTGDLFISCLAEDADGVFYPIRIKEPFRETVRLKDGAGEYLRRYAVGHVRCTSVKMSGGDGGHFTWEAEYDADVSVLTEKEGTLTSDVYSTAFESEIQRVKAPVVSCLAGVNSRLSVDSAKTVGALSGKEVVFVTSKVSRDRAECTADGKLVLSGSCNVTAILADDDGITSEELAIPFRYECECKRPTGMGTVIMWDADVISADGRFDGEKLSVSCELAFSALAMGTFDKSYVGRVLLRRDEPVGISGEVLKLYFPLENETMWDIGKRYHCRLQSISVPENSSAVLISAK